MLDVAGGEIEPVDIGDATGAIDDPFGLDACSTPSWVKITRSRPLAVRSASADAGHDPDSDPRGLAVQLATASLSTAVSSCGRASRIVTAAPARA